MAVARWTTNEPVRRYVFVNRHLFDDGQDHQEVGVSNEPVPIRFVFWMRIGVLRRLALLVSARHYASKIGLMGNLTDVVILNEIKSIFAQPLNSIRDQLYVHLPGITGIIYIQLQKSI